MSPILLFQCVGLLCDDICLFSENSYSVVYDKGMIGLIVLLFITFDDPSNFSLEYIHYYFRGIRNQDDYQSKTKIKRIYWLPAVLSQECNSD